MTNSQNNFEFLSDNTEEVIVLKEETGTDTSNENRVLTVSSSGKTRYKKRKKSTSTTKKYKKVKKILLITFCVFIFLALLIVVLYSYFNDKGKKELLRGNVNATIEVADTAQSSDNGQTVIYNGETYRYNKDLVSIVIMGIDKSELGAEEYGTAGQADAVYIFTYDTNSSKCTLIPVSRETMTEVQLYSVSGHPLGYETMQLCLSYAYGDGKESSCLNTLDALSRVFYNIPFTNYVALSWDAIAPLNDAVGGVTLTSLQDILTGSVNIREGDYTTLSGEEAYAYIRYRDTSKLESNPDRINRQKQYISEFTNKVIVTAKEDPAVLGNLYDAAADYMYSNVSRSGLLYIASNILPNVYSSKDINNVNIAGKTKQGEIHAEFYPDDTALYETILNVFYLKEIE